MRAKFVFPHIKKKYDNIFLSPHLDDAILSCGGQIAQKTLCNEPTLIVTIAAGNPPNTLLDLAKKVETNYDFSNNVVSIRRKEDIEACKTVGADYCHWDVPDCIYRLLPSSEDYIYHSEEDIFKIIHPIEKNLIVTGLATLMNELPVCNYVYCPLAVGNHVDHQITKTAAEKVFGKSLIYYEDLPYAMEKEAITNAINFRYDLHPNVILLSSNSLKRKIKAISKYESQIPALFGDFQLMRKKVISHTESIGGERIWLKE